MIKLRDRKAALLFKMYGEQPFSYIDPAGRRKTIFACVSGEYGEDSIFRVQYAEEYYRKYETKELTNEMCAVLDLMQRMVMQADYALLHNMHAEIAETLIRMTKLASGDTVERRP